MAQPPRKRVTKAKGYQRPDHEGKLYRVRDKDYMDGTPVKIWGENLTYESAHALKEKVVGSKRSRTARIEEMSISLPSADPTLEAVRQKGLAAGRVAAQAAQHRAHNVIRKRQEAYAASAPRPRAMPKAPEMELDSDAEIPDIADELDEQEAPETIASSVVVDDEISEYEQKGKALYDAYVAIQADPSGFDIWEKLGPKEKAAFSFEAASDQGPHVQAVAASKRSMSGPTGGVVGTIPGGISS